MQLAATGHSARFALWRGTPMERYFGVRHWSCRHMLPGNEQERTFNTDGSCQQTNKQRHLHRFHVDSHSGPSWLRNSSFSPADSFPFLHTLLVSHTSRNPLVLLWHFAAPWCPCSGNGHASIAALSLPAGWPAWRGDYVASSFPEAILGVGQWKRRKGRARFNLPRQGIPE